MRTFSHEVSVDWFGTCDRAGSQQLVVSAVSKGPSGRCGRDRVLHFRVLKGRGIAFRDGTLCPAACSQITRSEIGDCPYRSGGECFEPASGKIGMKFAARSWEDTMPCGAGDRSRRLVTWAQALTLPSGPNANRPRRSHSLQNQPLGKPAGHRARGVAHDEFGIITIRLRLPGSCPISAAGSRR